MATGGDAFVLSLTQKLEAREADLSEASAVALMAFLPRLGPAVLDQRAVTSSLFGASAQDELAVLVARLVLRLPAKQRFRAAGAMLESAMPLTFALECLRALRLRVNDAQDPMFDPEALDRLAGVLAARVLEAPEAGSPLWEREPRWAPLLHLAASGRHQRRVHRLVRGWLKQAPDAVDVLLTGAAGKALDLGSGQTKQQDFTRAHLQWLATVTDVRDVRRAVRTKYGPIKVSGYPGGAEYQRDPTRTVVEQFVFVVSETSTSSGDKQ